MYTSIVVGTDGSPTARAAVEQAVQMARLCGARLHLVSVYRRPGDGMAAAVPEVAMMAAGVPDADVRASVEAMVERTASEIDGLDVVIHVCAGAPGPVILDVAKTAKAELVVLGNRGMKGARRVLGSVPNHVAHHAECAVMIVPTC